MDDMRGFIFFKEPFCLLWIPMDVVKLEMYVLETSAIRTADRHPWTWRTPMSRPRAFRI
jgi:hypothetical protein